MARELDDDERDEYVEKFLELLFGAEGDKVDYNFAPSASPPFSQAVKGQALTKYQEELKEEHDVEPDLLKFYTRTFEILDRKRKEFNKDEDDDRGEMLYDIDVEEFQDELRKRDCDPDEIPAEVCNALRAYGRAREVRFTESIGANDEFVTEEEAMAGFDPFAELGGVTTEEAAQQAAAAATVAPPPPPGGTPRGAPDEEREDGTAGRTPRTERMTSRGGAGIAVLDPVLLGRPEPRPDTPDMVALKATLAREVSEGRDFETRGRPFFEKLTLLVDGLIEANDHAGLYEIYRGLLRSTPEICQREGVELTFAQKEELRYKIPPQYWKKPAA